MAAPTTANVKWYRTSSLQNSHTAPVILPGETAFTGGAPDYTSPLSYSSFASSFDLTLNHNALSRGDASRHNADLNRYSGFYIRNEEGSGGKLESFQMYIRNGIKASSSSNSVVRLVTTSVNAGRIVRVHGINNTTGLVDFEDITTVNGTATGTKIFQSSNVFLAEVQSPNSPWVYTDAIISGANGMFDPLRTDDIWIYHGTVSDSNLIGTIPVNHYQAVKCRISVCRTVNTNLVLTDGNDSSPNSGTWNTLNQAIWLTNASGATISGGDARQGPDTSGNVILDGQYVGCMIEYTFRRGMIAPQSERISPVVAYITNANP